MSKRGTRASAARKTWLRTVVCALAAALGVVTACVLFAAAPGGLADSIAWASGDDAGDAWHPDTLGIKRLLASGNAEEALERLKQLVTSVRSYSGSPGFSRAVAAIAEASAEVARGTGDYPGLLSVWSELLESDVPDLTIAARLGMGAVYAAGAETFPAWRNKARASLSAVVQAVPFSPMTVAARSLGRQYGIPVARTSTWVLATGGAIGLAVLTAMGVYLRRRRLPRPPGVLTIMSPKGEFPASVIDLSSTARPGKGIAFCLVGGQVKAIAVPATVDRFLQMRRDERSICACAIVAAFPARLNVPGKHLLHLWFSEFGRVEYHSGRRDVVQDESDVYIDEDCEVRCSSFSVQVSGLGGAPLF